MPLVQQTITFGGSDATQVLASAPPYIKKLFIEPLSTNTHVMFVGNSALTQSGGAGVISRLAEPNSTVTNALDRFELHAQGSDHNYDATEYWVWGTTGEGCNVTYWTF